MIEKQILTNQLVGWGLLVATSVMLVGCGGVPEDAHRQVQLELDEAKRAARFAKEDAETAVINLTKKIQEKEKEISEQKSQIDELQSELEKLRDEFEKYKEDYKVSVREKAPGTAIAKLTLPDGRVFSELKISKVTPIGISFIHSAGNAKLSFEELPVTMQKKYVYDIAEAAAYTNGQDASGTGQEGEKDEVVAISRENRGSLSRAEIEQERRILNARRESITSQMKKLEGQYRQEAMKNLQFRTRGQGTGSSLAGALKERLSHLAEYLKKVETRLADLES